jgi:hypothetical protein
MDAIYWINWLYKLIIYRRLDHNEISSIGDNTVDHVPSLLIHSRGFAYYLWVKFGTELRTILQRESKNYINRQNQSTTGKLWKP